MALLLLKQSKPWGQAPGLPPRPGVIWHPYRRRWVSEAKYKQEQNAWERKKERQALMPKDYPETLARVKQGQKREMPYHGIGRGGRPTKHPKKKARDYFGKPYMGYENKSEK